LARMAKHLYDIGKDTQDLLTESYPIDGTIKVSAQAKTFGFAPKVTLSRTLKKDKANVRETVSAVFEPKYEIKEYNLELNGKFTSSHDINVGTSVKDIGGKGSKVDLNIIKTDKDGLNGTALATYKNDALAIKGKATYPFSPKKPIVFYAEGVVHHNASNSNAGLGVEVSIEGETAKILGEGVLAHSTHDAQYKALLRYDVYDNTLNWGLSFWQKFNEKNAWAFDIVSEEWGSKTTFAAGAEHKIDDGAVKGKWKVVKTSDKTDYRFGSSIKKKLSPFATAIIGLDLNPRSFLGSAEGEPHTFGIELKLQD